MSACAGEFHSRIPLLCAACDFWAMSDRQLLVFSSLQGNRPTMEDAHGAEDSYLTSKGKLDDLAATRKAPLQVRALAHFWLSFDRLLLTTLCSLLLAPSGTACSTVRLLAYG